MKLKTISIGLCWICLLLTSCSYDIFKYNYNKANDINKQISNKKIDISELCKFIQELQDIDQSIRMNLSNFRDFESKILPIDKINEKTLKNLSVDFKKLHEYDHACYHNAWLIVQHSNNVDFQKQVLTEIAKNTEEYALLYDRIQINSGLKQKYGTQFDYDEKTGNINLKPVESMDNLNLYRRKCGLEPIEAYLEKSKKFYEHFFKNNTSFN